MGLTSVVKTFNELTNHELYSILRIRSEVFVVEQECVYQDLDFKDQDALHLFLVQNKQIIAYTRIFAPGIYFDTASIGRVVVDKSHRKSNLGHLIIKESKEVIKNKFHTSRITISAQEYLEKFYNSHLFKKVGEGYLEDGIPHIKMVYQA